MLILFLSCWAMFIGISCAKCYEVNLVIGRGYNCSIERSGSMTNCLSIK